MSLIAQIVALAQAVGADIKSLSSRTQAVTQLMDFGVSGGAGWGEPVSVVVAAPWVSATTVFYPLTVAAVAPNDQEEVLGQGLTAAVTAVVAGVSFTVTLSSAYAEGRGQFNVQIMGYTP